jgi:hypothetical protein
MTPILRRFNAAVERLEDQRRLGRILLETDTTTTATVARATLPGDTRRLRGIPAVARGVPGVSPGTDPHTETVRRNDLRTIR